MPEGNSLKRTPNTYFHISLSSKIFCALRIKTNFLLWGVWPLGLYLLSPAMKHDRNSRISLSSS